MVGVAGSGWRGRVAAVLAFQVGVVAVFAIGYDAYDFHVYALGGRAILQDQALYQFRWGAHGFPYPPFAAAAFLPLAQLPLTVARVVWDAASFGAWAVALQATSALAGRLADAAELAAMTAAGLVLEPVWHTLFLGQINLLLLAAVLVDVERIARGRTAGIGIGVATAVKLTPGIFIVLLLLAG